MTREARTPEVAASPRVSASVRLEPGADADRWLVTVDGVPVSRVSTPVAQTLRAMDGSTSVDELRRRFAPAHSAAEFADLLDRFRRAGLLHGSERRTAGRVTYRPPLTIQFATLRAPQLLAVLHRVLRPALVGWMRWPIAAVVLLGGIALVVQSGEAMTALASPLPLTDVLVVALVLVCATFAHEVAHGVSLAHAGARPRRAGVMLLYLGPAFFVDVTDAWRLPSRASRVVIALAGPAVHAVLAGAASLSALAAADADTRRTLLLLACACATVVVVNLVPFVRFDGYIALMSAIDEPNLRARTMADAGAAARRVLFGAEREPRALARWWSVPFGVLSVLVPTALVWFALERAVGALSGAGPVGALLVLVLQVAILLAVGVPVVRWLAAGARKGRGRVRFLLVGATLVAAIIGAAGAIPVADVRSAGFAVDGARTLLVVPADSAAIVPLDDGTPVVLSTRGILGDAPVASGIAHPEHPRSHAAPISAFAPVEVSGVEVDSVAVGVIDVPVDAVIPAGGRAVVHLGTRSLLSHVWSTHVADPVSALLASLFPSLDDPQEDRT